MELILNPPTAAAHHGRNTLVTKSDIKHSCANLSIFCVTLLKLIPSKNTEPKIALVWEKSGHNCDNLQSIVSQTLKRYKIPTGEREA